MFDNPTDNHTDIEVPLYYKLRFTKLKKYAVNNNSSADLRTKTCGVTYANALPNVANFLYTIILQIHSSMLINGDDLKKLRNTA